MSGLVLAVRQFLLRPGAFSKLIVVLVAAGGVAINQGLVDGTLAKWINAGIIAATALGVGAVSNRPLPTTDEVKLGKLSPPEPWHESEPAVPVMPHTQSATKRDPSARPRQSKLVTPSDVPKPIRKAVPKKRADG